jgi:hypothetical protein
MEPSTRAMMDKQTAALSNCGSAASRNVTVAGRSDRHWSTAGPSTMDGCRRCPGCWNEYRNCQGS